MPISFTINNDNVEMLLDDLRRIFPQLVNPGLPPMQEQPRENREPLPESNVKEIEPPKQRKQRGAKTEDHTKEVKTEDAGESAPATVERSDSSTASSSANDTEQQSAAGSKVAPSNGSTESSTATSTANQSPSGETIPDIDDVRARLKTLGATEGFGHDNVFEVLGKYKATNASSVPADKRAALIAEIDEMLKGGK